MNTLITYQRPSGNPLTVNDTPETRALAEANGWKEVTEKKEVKQPEKDKK